MPKVVPSNEARARRAFKYLIDSWPTDNIFCQSEFLVKSENLKAFGILQNIYVSLVASFFLSKPSWFLILRSPGTSFTYGVFGVLFMRRCTLKWQFILTEVGNTFKLYLRERSNITNTTQRSNADRLYFPPHIFQGMLPAFQKCKTLLQ